MRRSLRDLIRNEEGASLLEFAFVAPPLMAILIAILQTALVFLAQQGIETVAQSGGRLIMSGQAQQASMTAAQYKTALCARLPPYMSCSKLMVDVKTAADFDNAVLTTPTITYNSGGTVSNSFAFTPGTQGAIVVVRVMYLWPVIDGPLGFKLSNQAGGNRLLIASSVLKSEVY